MKLAIADPPYLGRAARWYGDGSSPHGAPRPDRRADFHPDAAADRLGVGAVVALAVVAAVWRRVAP